MKKLASIILAFLFLLPLAACSHGNTPQSYSKSFNDLFDTASTISAVDSSQEAFNGRFVAVYDTLKPIHKNSIFMPITQAWLI